MSGEYLSQLNEQQRAAVEYIDGPQLVIAGAGSGKTRVLTYKIVHLLAKGYEPGRIMALTFTNKAAREMRERIEAIAGASVAGRLWMGTFHSIFLRILRQNFDKVGYSRNFSIYDDGDSRSLIKNIIKDLDLDEKIYKPSIVKNAISWAKNALISPSAYAADAELMKADRAGRRDRIAEIYRIYNTRCRVADAMDFDDLLYYTAVLFRDNPGVLGHYREYFRYFLVDEYQDTNFAQNMIISQLALPAGKICVVGDDAQSIYSFRGANIRNILDLKKTFPTLRQFKLEQNYRSTQTITGAANALIAHNDNRIPKEVFSLGDQGEAIEVQSGHSDYDEAGMVSSAIVARRARTGDPLSEFAILYRTNAQSRVLEESLRRRNIAYRIVGGQAFYQRKEVKDALAYCRLSVNPHDDEALRRVINVPARSIGKVTVDKVAAAALAAEVSMWEVLNDPRRYGLDVNAGTQAKLGRFASLIESFVSHAAAPGVDAEAAVSNIMRGTGLIAMYMTDHAPENISKRENLEEFVKGAHSFVEDRTEAGEETSLSDFLADVSLATDQDRVEDGEADAVTLMTIHASKGLEFANVFVVGVEEDLLPSSMSHGSIDEIEEERRLFYVALTRAKNYCMLTYTSSRYLNGQTMICSPSRFLKEIPTQFLKYSYGAERLRFEMPKPPVRSQYGGNSRQSASDSWAGVKPVDKAKPKTAASPGGYRQHTLAEVSAGMNIDHPKFGRGVIEKVDTTSVGDVIVATFNGSDTRTLLLKFAQFKTV